MKKCFLFSAVLLASPALAENWLPLENDPAKQESWSIGMDSVNESAGSQIKSVWLRRDKLAEKTVGLFRLEIDCKLKQSRIVHQSLFVDGKNILDEGDPNKQWEILKPDTMTDGLAGVLCK
jgi:hypothetical protein